VPKGESDYGPIRGDKIYYLNFLIQLQHGEQVEYKRYRLVIDRDGIQEIQRM
jgi:hypothetical protein